MRDRQRWNPNPPRKWAIRLTSHHSRGEFHPATDDEVRASALQFVRKLAGFTKPSRANQPAFDCAVEEITAAAQRLLDSLVTSAQPRDREVEAQRAKARAAERFKTE